jgi:hypothetical protein
VLVAYPFITAAILGLCSARVKGYGIILIAVKISA